MKCCDITAGMLRHSAQIQSPTDTPDGQGGTVRVWTTVDTVRCRIKPVSSREQVFLESIHNTLAARMVMRYRADITGEMVVLFNGVRHNIRGVPRNLENLNRWLELDLEQGVAI